MPSIIKTTLSSNKRQEHSCKISTTKSLNRLTRKIGLSVGPFVCDVFYKMCDHDGKINSQVLKGPLEVLGCLGVI